MNDLGCSTCDMGCERHGRMGAGGVRGRSMRADLGVDVQGQEELMSRTTFGEIERQVVLTEASRRIREDVHSSLEGLHCQ